MNPLRSSTGRRPTLMELELIEPQLYRDAVGASDRWPRRFWRWTVPTVLVITRC